jgi:hypothetical protein
MKIPGYTRTSYTDVQVTACNRLCTIGDFIKPLQDQGRVHLPERQIRTCNSSRRLDKVISMVKLLDISVIKRLSWMVWVQLISYTALSESLLDAKRCPSFTAPTCR